MQVQYVGTGLSAEAKRHLIADHYLRRVPNVVHGFELLSNECAVVGVLTFSVPASRHLQTGVCPQAPNCVLELSRLWVDNAQPHGTASWFIARALRRLPPLIIVSYADTAAGHDGTVYRAANFFYAGWTDMDRKTPRFDYVDPSGGHSRNTFRSGPRAAAQKVRRKPKARYWTVTGSRADKQKLRRQCQWETMDWRLEPVPTEHRQRVDRC